jgi:hypothetical protein
VSSLRLLDPPRCATASSGSTGRSRPLETELRRQRAHESALTSRNARVRVPSDAARWCTKPPAALQAAMPHRPARLRRRYLSTFAPWRRWSSACSSPPRSATDGGPPGVELARPTSAARARRRAPAVGLLGPQASAPSRTEFPQREAMRGRPRRCHSRSSRTPSSSSRRADAAAPHLHRMATTGVRALGPANVVLRGRRCRSSGALRLPLAHWNVENLSRSSCEDGRVAACWPGTSARR